MGHPRPENDPRPPEDAAGPGLGVPTAPGGPRGLWEDVSQMVPVISESVGAGHQAGLLPQEAPQGGLLRAPGGD